MYLGVTHPFTKMPSAAEEKTHHRGNHSEDPIDPYELVRRLSAVQAQEIEQKRFDWETDHLDSRGEQQGEDEFQSGTQFTAPNFRAPHQIHRRSKSISLAPNQLPPPAYSDLPPAPRKQSLPLLNRPQAARRPSQMRTDSMLDLETISEDTVIAPSLASLFPETTVAERKRRRSSMLLGVTDHSGPNYASTQPPNRRKSTLFSMAEMREITGFDPVPSNGQPKSRRQSATIAQRRHSRQDWSQSDESEPRRASRSSAESGGHANRRRSSLAGMLAEYWKPGDKLGEYQKPQSADQSMDVDDNESFDSRAPTLRNSWRSSMGGSASSRRTSLLKKVGDHWVVRPPPCDETGVQDIHTDEEDPVVRHASVSKRMSGLFSKLRL